ncbi:MAG: MoxR family ATPase [Thiolinea sp.]
MSPSPPLSMHELDVWRERAHAFQQQLQSVVLGMENSIHLLTISVFARGHTLLEGDVGVGKTTLLRSVARAIGGAYERVEGTIDLMPNDLIYHTYINESGKPQIDPGPLLRQEERLATFFFNEVNRARPQVHSLLLRVMAEQSVQAFNRQWQFPHLQVFADRNRVERDETYNLPPAARDRFMLEIRVEIPADSGLQKQLIFNPAFHQVDTLLKNIQEPILDYQALNAVAQAIQQQIKASDAVQDYALRLWEATRQPAQAGVDLPDVDTRRLLLSGASPRGMSLLMRAARVLAWLQGRDYLMPEDIRDVFQPGIAHRLFFAPVYELRRETLAPLLIQQILQRVPV